MKLQLFKRQPKYWPFVINVAFALGAAVLIWAGVGARLTRRQAFIIPLEVISPDGVDWNLQAKSDGKVRVTLEGPSEALAALSKDLQLDSFHLRARINLARDELGDKSRKGYVLDLSPSRDLEIPRRFVSRLRAVSCEPGFVLVDLSPIVEREYSTIATQQGEAPRGETVIDQMELEQSRVRISGSLDRIKAYEDDPDNRDKNDNVVVRTLPVDVRSATQTFTVFRAFALPNGLTSVPAGSPVTVRFKKKEDYESSYQTKSFELEVYFLVVPGLKGVQHYELIPPRTRIKFDIEGKTASIQAFEKALKSSQIKKRPYALIRINKKLNLGVPQTGEVELGNCDPKGLTIRGDNTALNYKAYKTQDK
jgi:hypothetical protein